MCGKDVAVAFADVPPADEIRRVINSWHKPGLSGRLRDFAVNAADGGVLDLAYLVRRGLSKIVSMRRSSQLEVEVIGWLYDFIRMNVKRGRVFDFTGVLYQGRADCLGYAKLFTLLGRLFGLDVGVIEVVVDNAGRYVPHTTVLVRLTGGRLRIVDLWYGSTNIRHKRLGLQVKQDDTWMIKDIEIKMFNNRGEKCYLPDSCVDAITQYVYGNRYLNSREFDKAIKCYSEAIYLYPGNVRFFYNRAVAYDNLGEYEKAEADYAQALRDEDAVIRVLAAEHDEVTSLIDLDAMGFDSLAQDIYLLRHGFITGKKVPFLAVDNIFRYD